MAIKIVARLTEMPPARLSAAKRSACSRHSREVNCGLLFSLGLELDHHRFVSPKLIGEMKASFGGRE
jgi:hypothetical protein